MLSRVCIVGVVVGGFVCVLLIVCRSLCVVCMWVFWVVVGVGLWVWCVLCVCVCVCECVCVCVCLLVGVHVKSCFVIVVTYPF